MAGRHFVYLYADVKGQPMYVGYGTSAQRALSHRGRSHNPALKKWLSRGSFELRIAGPYGSAEEAKAVEAAIISAVHPKFNVAPGDGPKFLPLGVPHELGERPSMPPLKLRDIGIQGKGTILVYLSPGDVLRDGRPKFDPAAPIDRDAFSNIERSWDLTNLVEIWRRRPELMPHTIVGVHGKTSHRFIVGSLEIDKDHLCDTKNLRTAKQWSRPRWRVATVDPTDLDHASLRGRRVEGVTFGQFSHQLHIWVDAKGRRRH